MLGYCVLKRQLSSTTSKRPFLMVASIGNPEPEYANSRHSVGHLVLNKLVEHWQFSEFQKHPNLAKGCFSMSPDSNRSNVLLFKSNETFMNVQGHPISTNWNVVKRVQSQKYLPMLVVVHDEIQVPLGRIQVRKPGTSARGHNGLRSIDKQVQDYTKIAIGIGKPPNKYVADYVLARFKKPELEVLQYDVLPQVAEVIEKMAS